jgi:hypothetical protein
MSLDPIRFRSPLTSWVRRRPSPPLPLLLGRRSGGWHRPLRSIESEHRRHHQREGGMGGCPSPPIDAYKALEEQRRHERAATLALEEKEVVPEADDTISSPDDDTSSRDATLPTSTLRLLWSRMSDPSSPSSWILSPPSTPGGMT